MKQDGGEPTILIVDDEGIWRDERIPAALKPLRPVFSKAASPEEALQIVAERERDEQPPFDLVILDMHMPLGGSHKRERDAGERWLRVMRAFRLLRTPVIVYTSYPRFSDCVAMTKAGIDAYVSKGDKTEEEIQAALGEEPLRPREKLLAACVDRLGEASQPEPDVPPTAEWLHQHYGEIQSKFAGKWVAFVPQDLAQEGGLVPNADSISIVDGFAVAVGSTYEAVRDLLIQNPIVFRCRPAIVLVPEPDQGNSDATVEDEQ